MRGTGSALAVAALMLGAASADAAGIKQYKTEAGAQKHCPGDKVVWGSPDARVYHMNFDCPAPREFSS